MDTLGSRRFPQSTVACQERYSAVLCNSQCYAVVYGQFQVPCSIFFSKVKFFHIQLNRDQPVSQQLAAQAGRLQQLVINRVSVHDICVWQSELEVYMPRDRKIYPYVCVAAYELLHPLYLAVTTELHYLFIRHFQKLGTPLQGYIFLVDGPAYKLSKQTRVFLRYP